jgi:hypothetical protein
MRWTFGVDEVDAGDGKAGFGEFDGQRKST